MPGATLATVAGTCSASSCTQDHGGDQPCGSKRLLPPDRLAGSTYAAATRELVEGELRDVCLVDVDAGARTPRVSTLARATAAVVASYS